MNRRENSREELGRKGEGRGRRIGLRGIEDGSAVGVVWREVRKGTFGVWDA